MDINKLCKDAHNISISKGWYPKEGRNIGELIALIHSELSEALEEARKLLFKNTKNNNYTYFLIDEETQKEKPEGFSIEIADAVIRIADMCGYLGIDLEKAIKTKMAYNKIRSNKHGGKIF